MIFSSAIVLSLLNSRASRNEVEVDEVLGQTRYVVGVPHETILEDVVVGRRVISDADLKDRFALSSFDVSLKYTPLVEVHDPVIREVWQAPDLIEILFAVTVVDHHQRHSDVIAPDQFMVLHL